MAIAIPPLPSLPSLTQSPEVAAASSGANAATPAATGTSGTDFLSQLGQAIDSLQQTETSSDTQALGVADGTGSISDYMVTAEQANLQAELTDTVAEKAVAAFNVIAGMQF